MPWGFPSLINTTLLIMRLKKVTFPRWALHSHQRATNRKELAGGQEECKLVNTVRTETDCGLRGTDM